MQEVINTFSDGLSVDIAKSLTSNKTMLDNLDIRIISDGESSTGIVTNTKGEKFQFSFPNIPTQGSIPAQTNPILIGSCTVRNNIVLFTTTQLGVGQIWKVTYNYQTETFDGLVSGSLVVGTHLIYNQELNFSVDNRIKAIGRYETQDIVRVYWTDQKRNPLRCVNINNNNLSSVDVKLLDIIPDVAMKSPILDDISNGGNLESGVYSYSYRLIHRDGAVSSFAPLSNQVSITPYNPYGDYQEYQGGEKGEQSGKSIKVKIPTIDQNYDYVQLLVVAYIEKNIPRIYLLEETQIKNYTNLTIIHSGNEKQFFEITDQEFTALLNPFTNPKSIDIKDNVLFAANTEYERFDIDFDARAYRFNSTQNGRIYDKTGTLEVNINGASPTWPSDTTLDAINPFNDENPTTNADWASNDQYKYQADGTTLGGEGPNISYEFFTEEVIGDAGNTEATATVHSLSVPDSEPKGKPFVNVEKQTGSGYSSGQTTFKDQSSFTSLKSPFKESILLSAARGEVYRTAIVFYDKKHRQSYVKWIGDIKIPFHNDSGYEIAVNTVSDDIRLHSIGINFTVDVSSIATEISGFRIVMVERKPEDRTRLGFGVTGSFIDHPAQSIASVLTVIDNTLESYLKYYFGDGTIFPPINLAGNIANRIREQLEELANPEDASESEIRRAVQQAFEFVGSPLLGTFGQTIASPIWRQLSEEVADFVIDLLDTGVAGIGDDVSALGASIAGNDIGYVISPITSFGKYKFKTNDYLRILNKYEAGNKRVGSVYHVDSDTGFLEAVDSTAYWRKWFPGEVETSHIKRTITKEKVLEVGEIVDQGFDESFDEGKKYVNAYIGRTEFQDDAGAELVTTNKVMGIGDKKHFILTDSAFPSAGATYTRYDYNTKALNNTSTYREIEYEGDYLVAYERYLDEQYGGNWYEARTNNEYVSLTEFVPTTDLSTTMSVKTTQFDTYVAVFDAVNYGYYMNAHPNFRNPRKLKKAAAEIFPCEVPFNVELRIGEHFAADQSTEPLRQSRKETKRAARRRRRAEKAGLVIADEIDTRFVFDEFVLNDVYEQRPNLVKFIPKPTIYIPNEDNTNWIWSSQTKVDGELIDNWRKFKALDFLPLDPQYGEINEIKNFKGKLYAFQETGFANIYTGTTTNEGEDLSSSLGLASTLKNKFYISTEAGTQHQFSVVNSGGSLYFVDSLLKKIFRYREQITAAGVERSLVPLSDLKQIRSKLEKSNLHKLTDDTLNSSGIHCSYDPDFSSINFTILGSDEGDYTISFNELTDTFESYRSFKPNIYIESKGILLSIDPESTNSVFIHNKGDYNRLYEREDVDTYIKFVINDGTIYTKSFFNQNLQSDVLDSSNLDVYNKPISKIRFSNDYQDTGEVNLIYDSNVKRNSRTWHLVIPRSISDTFTDGREPRMKDKYLTCEIWFSNTENYSFKLHNVGTTYRINTR